MSKKIQTIHKNVVIPALTAINKYDEKGAMLVTETGMTESLYQHVRQVEGIALSWWQIEPATHDDIWSNFLGASNRQYLIDGILQLTDRPGVAQELEVNPFYAAAMCRIHYMRFKPPLPEVDDRIGRAEYWKKFYNTNLGKGSVAKYLENTANMWRT